MRSNCKRPIASPSTLDPGSPDTHFTNAVCTPTTAASAFAVHGSNPGTSADTSMAAVRYSTSVANGMTKKLVRRK